MRVDKVGVGPPEIATWRDGDRDFRGTVARVRGGPDAPPLVVAVALDIEHHVEYLRAFNRSLWASIASCALLIGLLGWAAARRGLAPVRDMASVAQRISASRLDDRLAVETLPHELTELAVAFNGMLGGTGSCYDNAVTESFFGTLKREPVHHCFFKGRAEEQSRIFWYIEGFYHRKRRHSAISYQSPDNYERLFFKRAA